MITLNHEVIDFLQITIMVNLNGSGIINIYYGKYGEVRGMKLMEIKAIVPNGKPCADH